MVVVVHFIEVWGGARIEEVMVVHYIEVWGRVPERRERWWW